MAGSIDNETILASLNQVIKAINDLIISINITNQGGATGSHCVCSIPSDTIIDPPPAPTLEDPETGDPPTGFEDWTEYNGYKCAAANKLVDDLIATCNNLSSIPGIVSGLSAGLAFLVIQAAFFATGPAAIAQGLIALGLASATGVATVIAALVAIVLFGAATLAYFTSLATNLGTAKTEIVCMLYNSTTVEEARSGLLLAVDEAISTIGGIDEAAADLLNSAVTALLGTAVFNSLFEPVEGVGEYVGTVDCLTECAECEDPVESSWSFATDEDGWVWSEVEGTTPEPGQYYGPFETVTAYANTAVDRTTKQRWTSPVGCWVGDTFQVNLSATANPATCTARGIIHYVDDTEDIDIFTTSFNTLGTNYSIDVNPEKQVVWVAVEWETDIPSGSFNFTFWFNGPAIFFVG